MIKNLNGDLPLHGRTLFLLANIPTKDYCEEYSCTNQLYLDIEESIISLARAVFSKGGHIVLKGNTFVSLLVAFVASEYIPTRVAEGRSNFQEGSRSSRPVVTIYQQMTREEAIPEIQFLGKLGYLTLKELNYEENIIAKIIEETDPVALVCIGGSNDLIRDLLSFHRLRDEAPIYTIATMIDKTENFKHINQEIPLIQPIDINVIEELRRKWQRWWQRKHEGIEVKDLFEMKYKPYGLIMQILVEEIIHSDLNR